MKRDKKILWAACAVLAALVTGVSLKSRAGAAIPAPALPVGGGKTACEFSDGFEIPQAKTAKLCTLDIASLETMEEQAAALLGVEDLEPYLDPSGGNGSLFYSFEEKRAVVSIDPRNGFWSVTTEDPTAAIPPQNLPSDEKAVQIAKDYVKAHSLFEGDMGEPAVSHSYAGGTLTERKQDLDVTVTFYPSIEGYEVYGLYRIAVVIGDHGVIQSVFKQASPVKSFIETPLKNRDQVIAEATKDSTGFVFTEDVLEDGKGNSRVAVTGCELKYYVDGAAANGNVYAYPVYVLTGHGVDGTQAGSCYKIIDAIQR